MPYLPRSRAFKSGITEALNFIRDSVEDLLTKRAIVYTIDNSAVARDFSSNLIFVDEDELERLKNSKEPEGKIVTDLSNNKIFDNVFSYIFFTIFFLIILIKCSYLC